LATWGAVKIELTAGAWGVMSSNEEKEEAELLNEAGRRILEERARLKSKYRGLFEAVSEILFRHDPVGINFETNTDEYEPEVETILPRLENCKSISEVRTMIHNEFIRWFDADTAGAEEQYENIAREVWSVFHDTSV
jgi:hypothetical protein